MNRGRDLRTVAAPLLYAEDVQVGDFMDLGSVVVTKDEIVEFGLRYDPLPIHTDTAAAVRGGFCDVIAPSALLIGLYSSLASRLFIPRLAIVAGKGINRLRIPSPATPGATLAGHIAIEEIIGRTSGADVHTHSTFCDGDRTVLVFDAIQVVRSRTGATSMVGDSN